MSPLRYSSWSWKILAIRNENTQGMPCYPIHLHKETMPVVYGERSSIINRFQLNITRKKYWSSRCWANEGGRNEVEFILKKNLRERSIITFCIWGRGGIFFSSCSVEFFWGGGGASGGSFIQNPWRHCMKNSSYFLFCLKNYLFYFFLTM